MLHYLENFLEVDSNMKMPDIVDTVCVAKVPY